MKEILIFGVDVNVPNWVKYAAKNDDGWVYIYDRKPFACGNNWNVNGGNYIKIMRIFPSIHHANNLIEIV